RNAERFCGELMVGGEVLRDADCTVGGVANRDGGGWRLRGDELFYVIPLAGDFAVEGVVDQNGKIELFCFHPFCNLFALFALGELDVVLCKSRRGFLLSDHGDGERRASRTSRRARGSICQWGEQGNS